MTPLMRLVSDPRNVERQYSKVVAQCPADRGLLGHPEIRQTLTENWANANRGGLAAWATKRNARSVSWAT